MTLQRRSRHLPGSVPLVENLADGQHGVHKRRHKSPIASWLGLSRRIRCTIRGENCPIASCTTTMVIVRTSVARHHRDRDRRQDRGRRRGSTDNHLWDRVVGECPVERDRAEGDRSPRKDAHDRHEPEARPHADRELLPPHEPTTTLATDSLGITLPPDRRGRPRGSPFGRRQMQAVSVLKMLDWREVAQGRLEASVQASGDLTLSPVDIEAILELAGGCARQRRQAERLAHRVAGRARPGRSAQAVLRFVVATALRMRRPS